MASQERLDVELALGVEAGVALRGFLPEQAVCADDLRLAGPRALLAEKLGRGGVVQDEQVVANAVEGVDVAALQAAHDVGDGRHFLVEHRVAQFLRPPDVLPGPGEPDFERADPAQRALQPGMQRGARQRFARCEKARARHGRAGRLDGGHGSRERP